MYIFHKKHNIFRNNNRMNIIFYRVERLTPDASSKCFFMKFAIDLAKHSRRIGEIPVGCVIVDDKNKMVSYAFNSMKKNHDPTAHAEIIAIRKACNKLKTTKLSL